MIYTKRAFLQCNRNWEMRYTLHTFELLWTIFYTFHFVYMFVIFKIVASTYSGYYLLGAVSFFLLFELLMLHLIAVFLFTQQEISRNLLLPRTFFTFFPLFLLMRLKVNFLHHFLLCFEKQTSLCCSYRWIFTRKKSFVVVGFFLLFL